MGKAGVFEKTRGFLVFAALRCGSESDCHSETRSNCQCSVEFESVVCLEKGCYCDSNAE